MVMVMVMVVRVRGGESEDVQRGRYEMTTRERLV